MRKQFRLMDILVISYYTIASLLLFIKSPIPISIWWGYLLQHIIFILAVIGIVKLSTITKNKWIKILRNFYPLVILFFTYKELNTLIPLISPKMLDSYVTNFEFALLGFYPTVLLQKIVNPFVTEFIKIAYFSYYFMIYLPPIFLYINKQYKEFNDFIETILIAFYICYTCFLVIPVAGPRFALAHLYTTELTGFIFTPFQDFVMKNGESIGACLPSSHVAVGCVALVMVSRYFKKVMPVMLPFVFFMCIATVYCRYHYTTDVVLGIATTALAIYLRPKLHSLVNRTKTLPSHLETSKQQDLIPEKVRAS